jgi:hypothetical protein
MTKRPTEAQLRVLRNLVRGLEADSDMLRRSKHCGFHNTLRALASRGLAVWEAGAWRITEAGREAVEKGGQAT